MACYNAFRYVHLLHHKHVNDEHRDPDHWASGGDSWYTIPFHWATLDCGYIAFVVKNYKTTPTLVFQELAVVCSFLVVLGYTIHTNSLWTLFFTNWFIPLRIAVLFLGFAFDWLPHYPFDGKERWDNTTLLRTPTLLEPFVTLLLFYQNYHIVHHLWPSVSDLSNFIFCFCEER